MELFQNREFINGMKEFDKLCTTITELPKQLAKTMSAKLDHLFLTTYPIIPSLPGELPRAYINDRIEFIDFIKLLSMMVINYYKLSRPVSSAVAWLRLRTFLAKAKTDRPDVFLICNKILSEFEDLKEWQATQKYIETIQGSEEKTTCDKNRETGGSAYRERTRSGSIPMTDCPTTIIGNRNKN